MCFELLKTPALGTEQGRAGASLGGATTGRGDEATARQAGTPPTRPPAARTVSDGTPATRSEATGATERSFAAASQYGRHTSHVPPAPSERVLKGSNCTSRLLLNMRLPASCAQAGSWRRVACCTQYLAR